MFVSSKLISSKDLFSPFSRSLIPPELASSSKSSWFSFGVSSVIAGNSSALSFSLVEPNSPEANMLCINSPELRTELAVDDTGDT